MKLSLVPINRLFFLSKNLFEKIAGSVVRLLASDGDSRVQTLAGINFEREIQLVRDEHVRSTLGQHQLGLRCYQLDRLLERTAKPSAPQRISASSLALDVSRSLITRTDGRSERSTIRKGGRNLLHLLERGFRIVRLVEENPTFAREKQ